MDCPACHSPNHDGARFCQKCGAPLPVAGSEADPLIGKLVGGRYRVSEVIGEGGMGRVYVGEQQMGTTVRKVAIKTLLSQFAKDPQTVGRFMRECGTIAELEHPNTIKVYDYGQIEGSGEIYVAMEFLSGQSLEQALLSGPLEPERVDRILAQACGSLAEAHEKGIVHRDLKPANLFLTTRAGEGDVVKVLDFGIAKRDEKDTQQKLTQQGTILGTPPYMSPEQFTGKQLDTRSDVYSLAVVAYEMLTGRLPYEADTPWEWATQHMTAQPFPFEATPMGNQVPAKMRNAVMRGMAKNREQRHQNVRDFFDDFTIGSGPRLSMVGDRIPGGTLSGSMPGAGPMTGPITGPHTGPHMSARGGTQAGADPSFGGQAPGPTPTGGGSGMMPVGAHGVGPAIPAYAAPPAAKKGGSGGLIGVGVVLLLGLAGGGIYLATQGDDETETGTPVASGTGATTAPVGTGATPPATGATPPATGATPPRTASAAPSGSWKPPPGLFDTAPPKGENIDHCCNGVALEKQQVCNGIASSVKSGRSTKQQGVNQMRAQGIKCN